MKTALWTTCCMAALLGGCAIGPAVGPNYDAPGFADAPLHWLGLGQTDDTVALGKSLFAEGSDTAKDLNAAWWLDFNDPVLNDLMQRALTANGTLKAALAQVDVARAARLQAQANTLPSVNATGNVTRSKSAAGRAVTTSEQAALDASWEIDLFGANRRAAEAARAELGGARAEARLARLRLLAEVASSYLNVRSLQAQVDASQRSLAAEDEILRMVRIQQQEGVGSAFSVAQAEAQRASTAATLPLLESQLQAATYALGALAGMQPAATVSLLGDVKPVPTSRQKVLLETPAVVLARRPDVASAERALAAATANQGVALASWFPKLTLSGLFGIANTTTTATTHPWSWGGAAVLPVLDFGRVRALVRTADAKQAAALATYEQTVTDALADVETALTAFVKAEERARFLTEAADANAKSFAMAQAQAREGAISTLDLLTVEQKNLAAQSAKATGDAAAGQALATLYKAIGG